MAILPTYGTSVTDSGGNSYVHLTAFTMDGQPRTPVAGTGFHAEAFWCQSITGSLSEITVKWDRAVGVQHRIYAYKFRNHLGSPFNIHTYDMYDEYGGYYDPLIPRVAPAPAPSWTFANGNGLVILGVLSQGSFVSYGTIIGWGAYGVSSGGYNVSTARQSYSAGTTPQINPQWSSSSTAGQYKAAYAFGLEAKPGQTISNFNFFTTITAFGSFGFTSQKTFSTQGVVGTQLLADTVAGDGILIFAWGSNYTQTGRYASMSLNA